MGDLQPAARYTYVYALTSQSVAVKSKYRKCWKHDNKKGIQEYKKPDFHKTALPAGALHHNNCKENSNKVKT